MKSSELIGKRLRIVVKNEPCQVRMDGYESLTETCEGVALRFFKMPGGPVGLLHRDDGARIAFDAGLDITSGAVEIELL